MPNLQPPLLPEPQTPSIHTANLTPPHTRQASWPSPSSGAACTLPSSVTTANSQLLWPKFWRNGSSLLPAPHWTHAVSAIYSTRAELDHFVSASAHWHKPSTRAACKSSYPVSHLLPTSDLHTAARDALQPLLNSARAPAFQQHSVLHAGPLVPLWHHLSLLPPHLPPSCGWNPRGVPWGASVVALPGPIPIPPGVPCPGTLSLPLLLLLYFTPQHLLLLDIFAYSFFK